MAKRRVSSTGGEFERAIWMFCRVAALRLQAVGLLCTWRKENGPGC